MRRFYDAIDFAFSEDRAERSSPVSQPCRSFLLHGPRAVGKSWLISRIAEEMDLKVVDVTATDVYQHFSPDAPGSCFSGFVQNAARWPKGMVVMDHLHILFPKDEHGKDHSLVAQFVKTIQQLATDVWPNVVFVGVTNAVELLDPVVRAKFEDEIYCRVPDQGHRLGLLVQQGLSHQGLFDLDYNALCDINAKCGGRTIGEMHALLRDSVTDVVCDQATKTTGTGTDNAAGDDFLVGRQDLQGTLAKRQIGMSQKGSIEVPRVALKEVIGLQSVKEKLLEVVVWPYKYRKEFEEMGLKSSTGILLYGPPGTGKTMLAKATATEMNANFIPVHITDLIHGELGESERHLAEIFRLARCHSPCVVFIDELQAMFTSRGEENASESKLVSQLFLEMDLASAVEGVVVLAATNIPEVLDSALLAPGRMDVHLFVPPPTEDEREEILKSLFCGKLGQSEASEVVLHAPKIANQTPLYTGADLANLCNTAALHAYSRSLMVEQTSVDGLCILVGDIEHALANAKPSTTNQMLADLTDWHP